MTLKKDDGLWHAKDYDDEPRSHGNFGLDPCMQMMEAEAAARKRKEFEREMELARRFMLETLKVLSKLAEGRDDADQNSQ